MKNKLFIGLVLFLFTACVPLESIETRLKFSGEERWQIHIELLLAPESAVYTSEFDQLLDSEVAGMEEQGVEYSWRQEKPDREGKINYVIEFNGQGYELINSTILEQNAVMVDGETGNIIFNADLDYGDIATGGESKFILQGGKIISSNGNRVNNSTVEWINPTGPMEAVLTEGSDFNWLWLLLIPVVLGGGVAAYWFIFRKPATPTTARVPIPGGGTQAGQLKYCAECGTQMPVSARFCPECGATQQA